MSPAPSHRSDSTTPVLDDVDRRLIELLVEDGRAPVAGLAKRLGVARSTVQQRLARLEGAGVIAGYSVRLGVARPSGMAAYVHVTIDGKYGTRIADELAAFPQIRELHAVSGDADLLALVQTRSPEALDDVLDRIGRIPGVVRTSTSVVLSTKVRRPAALDD